MIAELFMECAVRLASGLKCSQRSQKNSTSDSIARKLFTVGGLGLNKIQKSCFRFDLYSALVAFLMSEKLVRFESMWTEKHVHDKLCWRAGMGNH